MFSGAETIRFASTSSTEEVFARVKTGLESLGSVAISKRGDLEIHPRRSLENFLTSTSITGDVRERSGEYSVTLEYRCALSAVGWIILIFGILFFLLGLFVVLGPILKKNDVTLAIRRALREVE